jgi:hypothetical protein
MYFVFSEGGEGGVSLGGYGPTVHPWATEETVCHEADRILSHRPQFLVFKMTKEKAIEVEVEAEGQDIAAAPGRSPGQKGFP